MPAIITRYLGPSNIKGSRVKAFVEHRSVTLTWDDALDADANHLNAAHALADRLEWQPRVQWKESANLPKGQGDRVHFFS